MLIVHMVTGHGSALIRGSNWIIVTLMCKEKWCAILELHFILKLTLYNVIKVAFGLP